MEFRFFYTFILGMLVMACAATGVFFLRFWRQTRDRLFAIFAIAFFLLGINWLLLVFMKGDEPNISLLYIVRLVAFLLIIVAILDKNRKTDG